MVTAAIALVFFGVGLIGLAIATLLSQHFGVAGGYAIAGAAFLAPPLLWAIIIAIAKKTRRPPPPSGGREFLQSFVSALARETPWAAVAGAGLVGLANLFLNRNKTKK